MDIFDEILGIKPIPTKKQPIKTFNLTRTISQTSHISPRKKELPPLPDHEFRLQNVSVKIIGRPKEKHQTPVHLPDFLMFSPPKSSIAVQLEKPEQKVEEFIPKPLKPFELPNLPKYIPPTIPEKVLEEPTIEIRLPLKSYELPVALKPSPPVKKHIQFEEDALPIPKQSIKPKRSSTPTNKKESTPKNYIIPQFISKQNSSSDTLYADIDIFDIYYNVPQNNDIAVMLVFFDYVGSARILMNYLYMVEKLKLANIPVFTLELVIYGKQPKIKDAFHVYGSSYLFQKEHLLRLLEKRIPSEFTKLACLDADILFDNPNWYDELSHALETYNIVQPFKKAYWLNLDYTEIQKKAGSVCEFNPKIHANFWLPSIRCHPGFGWCFRRDWYNAVGFYDLGVIGSGDTLFSHALFEFERLDVNSQEFRLYIESLYKWWDNTQNASFTDLNSNLYHMYHGPLKNRKYYDRFAAFKQYNNIEDIVAKNENDVYELTVPELNDYMFSFFKTREDDGID